MRGSKTPTIVTHAAISHTPAQRTPEHNTRASCQAQRNGATGHRHTWTRRPLTASAQHVQTAPTHRETGAWRNRDSTTAQHTHTTPTPPPDHRHTRETLGGYGVPLPTSLCTRTRVHTRTPTPQRVEATHAFVGRRIVRRIVSCAAGCSVDSHRPREMRPGVTSRRRVARFFALRCASAAPRGSCGPALRCARGRRQFNSRRAVATLATLATGAPPRLACTCVCVCASVANSVPPPIYIYIDGN